MNHKTVTPSVQKRKDGAREWERLQLQRLVCSLVLFLAVFLGKQIYPETMLYAGEEVMAVLAQTTDLQEVFAQLGESISDSRPTMEGIEAFCIEVFGPRLQHQNEEPQSSVIAPLLPDVKSGLIASNFEQMVSQRTAENPQETTVQETAVETEPVSAVGTILTIGPELEQALPAGYTVDELSFGCLETTTPVLGYLNSGFGYRDHPVKGEYLFHGGTDISGNAGDPIAAFADGWVEYVGEDDSYGLYFQLDHGNGIKSFYAHCQSVCVQTGQRVMAGETVALVGSTGTATGPHLHLELKCGDVRVDPAYYVEFLNE